MNLPNTLTVFRVVFSVAIFVLLPFKAYLACLVLFLLAAATDYLDGWWARRFKQVSVFGRIMDPFADKLLVCGVFTYLAAIPELTTPPVNIPGAAAWMMLGPWMAVVVLGRELFITSLRAAIERSGGDFSAKWIGKWKMGLQCVAIPACLLWLMSLQPWIFWTMILSLWGTIAITLWSGIDYVFKAVGQLGRHDVE